MKSPIPWPGGKRLMLKRLLKLIPYHETYIEAFCGGAGLLFSKERAKVEIINDIDGELINFFQIVKLYPNKFISSFNLMLHSRKWFYELLNQDPQKLSKMKRAVRFFYLRKSSFGGQGKVFGVSKLHNKANYINNIRDIISNTYERLKYVTIENMDYVKCISKYDNDKAFIFCDPPYRRSGDKFYCKSMSETDFIKLSLVLQNIKGKWLLCHSNDTLIRLLFKNYEMIEIKTKYTMTRGNNINFMNKERKELLIFNYKL